MSDTNVPYLCCGVVFFFLKHAIKFNASRREAFKGIPYDHSDPKMVLDMLRALSKTHAVVEIDENSRNAFKTEVSKFLNCKKSGSERLLFDDASFVSGYKDMVRNEYAKAMNQMQEFIDTHLDGNRCAWLVKAILDLIDRDTSISNSDIFFVSSDSIPKTKNEMLSMESFHLSAFLVGVMDYILMYRPDNLAGQKTFEEWCEKEDHKPWKLKKGFRFKCDRNITVIMDVVEEVTESNQGKVLPGSAESHSEQDEDQSDLPNVEEILESELREALPSDNNPSDKDIKLYARFKAGIEQDLHFIISNDPTAVPIDAFLPQRLLGYTLLWEKLVYKIEDKKIHETVSQTVDLINQYRYYLSDQFFRCIPERNILLVRNQSAEDACRNDEILRPETWELRMALFRQFGKMFDIPEAEIETEVDTATVKKDNDLFVYDYL